MATPTFGMYVSKESFFLNCLDCSYNIWYVYNKWSIWARTKVIRRIHIIYYGNPHTWKLEKKIFILIRGPVVDILESFIFNNGDNPNFAMRLLDLIIFCILLFLLTLFYYVLFMYTLWFYGYLITWNIPSLFSFHKCAPVHSFSMFFS